MGTLSQKSSPVAGVLKQGEFQRAIPLRFIVNVAPALAGSADSREACVECADTTKRQLRPESERWQRAERGKSARSALKANIRRTSRVRPVRCRQRLGGVPEIALSRTEVTAHS